MEGYTQSVHEEPVRLTLFSARPRASKVPSSGLAR